MSGEAADKAPPPTAKPRKKKKRARADADASEEFEAVAAPAEAGDQRPAFAKAFPRDAELDQLVDTFEAGNYAEVRERAQALVHATESDEVRRAARELLKRLEPDPIAVYMIAVAAALLAFLSFWYWTHPHAAP